MNKKLLMFGILGMFAIVLVTAAVVTYYSNTVTIDMEVTSPMQVSVTGADAEGVLSLDLFAGESHVFEATTTNVGTVEVVGALVEVKVDDFDGVGITYHHYDTTWSGDIPVCTFDGDAYYYIGPVGGFTAPADYLMTSTSTITTSPLLDPKTYTATIQVIDATARMC